MPSDFQDTNGLISFIRDTAASHKVGFDGSSLVWIGSDLAMRMEAPRVHGLVNYPDGGCSTEIYTPAGNAPYIEMEVLGPVADLPVGKSVEYQMSYTLFHRTEAEPAAEARIILGLPAK